MEPVPDNFDSIFADIYQDELEAQLKASLQKKSQAARETRSEIFSCLQREQ